LSVLIADFRAGPVRRLVERSTLLAVDITADESTAAVKCRAPPSGSVVTMASVWPNRSG